MESTPFPSFSQSSQPGPQPPSPQSSGQPRTGLPLASLVPAPRNGQPLPPDAGRRPATASPFRPMPASMPTPPWRPLPRAGSTAGSGRTATSPSP